MEIFKIKPHFSEKLWGSDKLKTMGFNIGDAKNIGEAWVISAHENGMGYIENGRFRNKSLKEVFDNNKDLFGNYQGEYPLLAKIITAKDFLSVQVHPDDKYALKNHKQLGKPESWIILDCPDSAQLIYGHNAQNKKDLESMIDNGEWDKLLKKVNVEKDDFVYVQPGKIHAITPNVVVYELQRSSDVTYRLYDYDRVDKDGQKRALDIQKSLDVTLVPDIQPEIIQEAKEKVFSSEVFSIYILDSKITTKFRMYEEASWLQFTVIDGEFEVLELGFKKGESGIICDLEKAKFNFKGEGKVIISWIKK
ncbi:type I phosphomannose isomerase catalytic subunit [Spiroplasma endosymbiont of Crioceris asparagi]|uniref:type I phosphomannose isomerase catalytic subunit n=1 Tax=Spiroplasma endosymbiont of Crioceris asparagi TaxID=3066286 RepID=UPI0030D3879D